MDNGTLLQSNSMVPPDPKLQPTMAEHKPEHLAPGPGGAAATAAQGPEQEAGQGEPEDDGRPAAAVQAHQPAWTRWDVGA
jgi:hypothetical protein